MAVAIATASTSFETLETGNPVNFGSLATGSAAADRLSVVCVTSRGGRGIPTAVSINSVSCTKLVEVDHATGSMRASIWQAANPSGTTGTVTATYSGSSSFHVAISVFSVTGADATISDTDSSDDGEATGNSISLTALTVPTNGGAICCGNNSEQTVAFTWTGATEYQDTGVSSGAGSFRAGSAYTLTAGTNTITMDGSDGDWNTLVGAAWAETAGGPAGQPAVKRMGGVPYGNQVNPRNISIW